ncbi:MAG: hypothetical protein LBG62_01475 [Candidatus Methanoplasma sp.]|jgi:hypothetical protein|nr:hypothetical protein [Candidatus Methanoplasma sp.]
MNQKILAAAIVALLAVAAVGALALSGGDGGDGAEQKKGLYRLDARVSMVDMGRCSATPGVVATIEQIYEDYYGEIGHGSLTLSDAKGDSEFWNQYCVWDPIVSKRADGALDVKSTTKAKGTETVVVPVADNVLVMGTMFVECMYFLACTEAGVEPYSEESFLDERVSGYLKSVIAGGLKYSYYEDNDTVFLTYAVDKSSYLDLGVTSVQSMDPEKLADALKTASAGGKSALYLASGLRIVSQDHYDNNTGPARKTGSSFAFFSPSDIPGVFQAIECIGALLGFDDSVVSDMIESLQLRLYRVYAAVQEETGGKAPVKAYFENTSGSALSSEMPKIILRFLGFDTSLLDGAEHDLESLLAQKPGLILFYTNDKRPESERMRTDT